MRFYKKNKDLRELFEGLFGQYYQSLCFYALSFVKDKEIARDLVHDVFLSLWNHMAEIDFEKPVYPYLVSLTRNRVLNYLEHLKVEDKHFARQRTLSEVYVSTDDSGYEELIAQIMQQMSQLPERCRNVMYLCFVEGKKHKEIAEELGVSITTVRTHIALGLKMLRQHFPDINLFLIWACLIPSVKK